MSDIPVLYEDNHLLVVCKPPNLPTQADRSGDADLLTLLKEDIKRRYDKPGAVYLGLVHRLDRPVGGLVVFARTSKAAGRLSAQLRDHALGRTYLAIVRGVPPDQARLVDYLVKDESANTVRVADADTPQAKQAILNHRCLAKAEGLALLEVSLETGRSHQIRVQLTHAGFPLWGDARYGNGQPGEQIALWGAALRFTHPTRGQSMCLTTPPPESQPWTLFQEAITSWIRETDPSI